MVMMMSVQFQLSSCFEDRICWDVICVIQDEISGNIIATGSFFLEKQINLLKCDLAQGMLKP
jgi:hypothetical protein